MIGVAISAMPVLSTELANEKGPTLFILTGLPLPPPPQDSEQQLCACRLYNRNVQLLYGTVELPCMTLYI